MARSNRNTVITCLICTISALAGAAGGCVFHKPLIAVITLLPAVIYEVYRTEGVSTIWASWGMLAVLIAEGVLIAGNFSINISKYAASYITGLPSIDLKLGGPVIMAYFSYILIRRTAGIYTRWLAVVIFLGCLSLFFLLDHGLFTKFTGSALQDQLKQIQLK